MKIIFITIFQFLFIGSAISQINNDYLKLGASAPKIVGINQFGEKIDSEEIIKNNRILLLFYRGYWCKYCKSHLKKLESHHTHAECTRY